MTKVWADAGAHFFAERLSCDNLFGELTSMRSDIPLGIERNLGFPSCIVSIFGSLVC